MTETVALDHDTVAHFMPDGSVLLEGADRMFTLSREAFESLRAARPGWRAHVSGIDSQGGFYYSRETRFHTGQVFAVKAGSSTWRVWSEGPGHRKLVAEGSQSTVDASMGQADSEIREREKVS